MADIATTAKPRGEVAKSETTRGDYYFAPRVDIFETDRELTLYADLPGVRSEDVDLQFENGELTLRGRVSRQEYKGQPWLQEYQVGDFYRVFRVHESIDASKISAECKHGVLTVHLPKVEAVQPRKIKIKGS